jgi:hypothetical protein
MFHVGEAECQQYCMYKGFGLLLCFGLFHFGTLYYACRAAYVVDGGSLKLGEAPRGIG